MSWRHIFKRLLRRTPSGPEPAVSLQFEQAQPGRRQKLTRMDVVRLIKENGGPEGLDLSAYDLSGANLTELDLHGIIFGNLETVRYSGAEAIERGSNLEGAWLERSNLRRANLGRVNLRGARLYKADLREATLWMADAEGALAL